MKYGFLIQEWFNNKSDKDGNISDINILTFMLQINEYGFLITKNSYI